MLRWGKHYFPHKFPKEFCWSLHGYLASIVHEEETFTLAPRDHAKSTIMCFLAPIYLALVKPLMYRHFLLVQETSTKAKVTNMNIRHELETNEKLIADYGDQITKEKWTEKQFILKNGSIFSCIGVGESCRGINVRNMRPDWVIVDDIYELKDCESSEAVRKKVAWYDSDLTPALADSSLGQPVSLHNIGTAINRSDHIHRAEKERHPFFKRFMAVIDFDKKETLWKTFEWLLDRKKRLGSIIFAREFQNEVRDDESAIIKYGDIKYYDGRTFLTKQEAIRIQKMERLDETPEHIVWNRGAVDPAEKEKEVNDFTARAAVILTSLGNFYIYDIENVKQSFNKNKEACISFYKRNNLEKMIIETNKGEALYQEIQRTTNINVNGKHERLDKITRKVKQSGKFENGKVFISMLIKDELRTELVEQLTLNKPNHDDISDAVINLLEESDKRGLYIG
jgi:phage terminase large subunit-like protein